MPPSISNSVVWSAIERFSTQGVTFLFSIVIARLVMPSEYGLIAMLAIFMSIAQAFIDSGFGSALIQKKDRNEADYSTVFFFNIAIAIILYGILYLCAPLIANFYEQPALTEITRWIGLNLIISSLSMVQGVRLQIALNFKLQAKLSLTAAVLSGTIGVTLAWHGYGVWALVAQTLSNNIIGAVLLWLTAKWHPVATFSIASFKRLFSFGSKLLASGLLHTIYLNLYSLVIGKFYKPADVGFYNRAYSVSQFPSSNIVSVIMRAAYPMQCEKQNDDEWLVDNFHRLLRMASFIVFPLMVLLAVIAKPLVLIVLTAKWLPAAILISILAIAYMWYPVMVVNNQMLNVKGRSDLFLRAEIIKKIVAVAILCATLPFGVIWLCLGVLFYSLFDMALIVFYVKKVISTGYRIQIRALLPIFLASALAGVAAFVLVNLFESQWLNLLAATATYVLSFLLFVKIFAIDESRYLLDLMRKHVKPVKPDNTSITTF